jgi:hypothetical protein
MVSKQTVAIAAALAIVVGLFAMSETAFAAGPVQAELRSAASILPSPLPAGMFVPSAPAGGLVIGSTTWACDAAQGLAPVVAVDPSSADPLLAVSNTGIHLPTAAGFGSATCGQLVYDGNGNVYITQGVLANNTPSNVQGILRVGVNPATGLPSGAPVVIAANSGLGGNQPTAIAVGPDGNLYFGNLKNGDIKRILNPSVGTTQTVQSVGKSPNGRPVFSLAFVGVDLYVASSESLSIIVGATNLPVCQGGCNGVVLNDGFSGVAHIGLTGNAVDTLYFSVAGSANQVWKYGVLNKTFTIVAFNGLDRTGASAGNFSFVGSKSNMLNLDPAGNLWIGDDTSNGTAVGAGRVWTIPSVVLATVSGGATSADPAIISDFRGPWFIEVGTYFFSATFNADNTFTSSIQAPDGTITTDAGTYALTGPVNPSFLANPQAHLRMTDSQGTVLIDGDMLLLNRDQIAMMGSTNSFANLRFIGGPIVWLKQTP